MPLKKDLTAQAIDRLTGMLAKNLARQTKAIGKLTAAVDRLVVAWEACDEDDDNLDGGDPDRDPPPPPGDLPGRSIPIEGWEVGRKVPAPLATTPVSSDE